MIIVGSYGTVTLRLVVRRAAGSVVDFTDATTGTISVRWPKLTPNPAEEYETRDWTPDSLEVVSESLAYLFYTLQDGDIPRVGNYRIAVTLTTPDGPIPCLPGTLPVGDRF